MTALERPPVALFVDPPSHHLLGDRLFDAEDNVYAGDRVLAPYARLRAGLEARGVPVHTGDALERGTVVAERNVYVSLGYRERFPRLVDREDVVLSAFFALECPIVEPRLYRDLPSVARAFRRTLTFSDPTNLLPFTRVPVASQVFRIPQSYDGVHEDLWSRGDRALLTIINANKRPRLADSELYSERLRAVRHFAARGEVDLYGVGWDVPPYRTGETWLPATAQRWLRRAQAARLAVRPDPLLTAARGVWRGAVASKSETLAGYAFALCFENMVLPGWITEKVFDCLLVGTVPVYLGAPEIADVLPPEAFVDAREFDGYDDLGAFLRGMSAAERGRRRDAGRDYLASSRYAEEFSSAAFAARFHDLLQQDAAWTG